MKQDRNVSLGKSDIKTIDCERQEEYLRKLLSLFKARGELAIVDKKTHFNHTEIRMLLEIFTARSENRRVISAELARRLGVTRAAISQMVNNLEAQGIVKRVADDIDRKIAYIEISEGVFELYQSDISKCASFVSGIVEEFGEENFNEMCRLFQAFAALVGEKIRSNQK